MNLIPLVFFSLCFSQARCMLSLSVSLGSISYVADYFFINQ